MLFCFPNLLLTPENSAFDFRLVTRYICTQSAQNIYAVILAKPPFVIRLGCVFNVICGILCYR